MELKKETAKRKAKRKYEQVNKEERKLTSAQFNTRLPRKEHEEITDFLKKHHIRKIDLIYAGYHALLEKTKNHTKE